MDSDKIQSAFIGRETAFKVSGFVGLEGRYGYNGHGKGVGCALTAGQHLKAFGCVSGMSRKRHFIVVAGFSPYGHHHQIVVAVVIVAGRIYQSVLVVIPFPCVAVTIGINDVKHVEHARVSKFNGIGNILSLEEENGDCRRLLSSSVLVVGNGGVGVITDGHAFILKLHGGAWSDILQRLHHRTVAQHLNLRQVRCQCRAVEGHGRSCEADGGLQCVGILNHLQVCNGSRGIVGSAFLNDEVVNIQRIASGHADVVDAEVVIACLVNSQSIVLQRDRTQ